MCSSYSSFNSSVTLLINNSASQDIAVAVFVRCLRESSKGGGALCTALVGSDTV